jgi:hypothetical protein
VTFVQSTERFVVALMKTDRAENVVLMERK